MMKKTTKTSPKKATSKIDLATPVSQRVEMDDIVLLETVAKRKQLRGELPANLALTVNVQTEVDKKQGVIQVRPRFILVARYDDASDDELLRIEAMFLLHYRVPSFEGLRKANLDAFGEVNGLYNAWPYWREFVQATTVRMGLPPLTMPIYRPLATEKSSKKVSSSSTPRRKRAKKKHAASVVV
ncbi:MAG: hypothetical protein WBE26_01090 [Phycisphaerae bacterium]